MAGKAKAGKLALETVKAGDAKSITLQAEKLPKGKPMRLIIDFENGERVEQNYDSTPQGSLNVTFPHTEGIERVRVVDVNANEVVADSQG